MAAKMGLPIRNITRGCGPPFRQRAPRTRGTIDAYQTQHDGWRTEGALRGLGPGGIGVIVGLTDNATGRPAGAGHFHQEWRYPGESSVSFMFDRLG